MSRTKADKAHFDRLSEHGCILCHYLGLGTTRAEIHHLRHGMGMGQRNSNKMVIGLCPEHHRGRTGYHGMGRRAFEREYGVTEMDLWEMSQKQSPAALAGAPGLSTAHA